MEIKENRIEQFLDALAGPTAAPGGGAAAALSGAMGAALLSMVCGVTLNRSQSTPPDPLLQPALDQTEALRRQLTGLAEADRRAFEQVIAAYGQPRTTEPGKKARQAAIEAALRQATLTPLEVVVACAATIRLAGQVIDKIKPSTLGDAAAAVRLAEAGLQTARLNMAINLASIANQQFTRQMQDRLNTTLAGLDPVKDKVLAYTRQHSGAIEALSK